jgi:hypothetical protein
MGYGGQTVTLRRRATHSALKPAGRRTELRRTAPARDLQVAAVAFGAPRARATRSRRSLPVLAFGASLCFVVVTIIDPTAAFAMSAAQEDTITIAPVEDGPTQTVVAAEGPVAAISRGEFKLSKIYVAPPVVVAPTATKSSSGAPAAGTPDPGSAQAIAHDMVIARGWGEDQYNCLNSLWKKESGWNVYAYNKSSGAYGIPQSLPGSKMASAGADWATNPATQITWGLGYITGRYSTPCGAWGHSQSVGWY